jgi:DNA ligase-1
VGLGIPIPIINERVAKTTGISDEEIKTNLTDYGVPRRDRPVLREVTYAELKSGKIEVHGRETPVSPLSSLKRAREIANILKEWIEGGRFLLSERLLTSDPEEGKGFLERALRAGHEGLIAKDPLSPYTPGIRGKHWLKIKPALEPLDLVIVGAEFGHGRRRRWLSDYYLAARDAGTGKFEVVGKTFKGLNDAEMQEMTEKLQGITVAREGRRVWVLPQVVVEVICNEIQRSPKYPCGMALRFARISRIRDDKPPEEADTIERVREMYSKQVKARG